ncbi:MAG: hypothetical protein U0O31_10605 [Catenibacterium sp.]|uniref:hypothetical protein n=1 Tax=Catenibacterium sp. TaxID=2049022 RepID=UPI002F94CE01
MKGPIVSIDVSKGKSDYQAFKNLNVKYTGSRSIKHTKEGFDEIVNLVREMEKKLETEVCVVYEATGVYHRVLGTTSRKSTSQTEISLLIQLLFT